MRVLKRISLITVIALLLLITNSFASTGKVNVNTLRVREKASTSAEIVTNLSKDDKVEVVDTEGDWYKVKVDGKEGYVKSEYVTLDKTTNNSTNNTSNNNSSDSFVSNSKTKVRALPSILSVSVGEIESGKELTKINEINNWYKVTDGTVTGWILSNKIGGEIKSEEKETTEEKTPEKETTKPAENTVKEETAKTEKKEENASSKVNKIAIVNVKTARVRDKASTSGEILDLLDYNDEVTILAEEGTWYKVKYGNKEGYMDSSLLTMKDAQGVSSRSLSEERQPKETKTVVESKPEASTPAPTPEPTPTPTPAPTPTASGSGQAVVNLAMQYIGFPYVYAGKSPETGFDCSGFTRYIFSNFGASLGATAASQNSVGREVSRGELVAGDLLLFYDEGKTKIGHTGIYIGNGDFVHAANPKRGVVTDNINTSSYYNERYITARRIVE